MEEFIDDEARRGLAEARFIPYFQPIVTLRTGQLVGFEVMARWQHPTESLIQTYQFVHLAERDGWDRRFDSTDPFKENGRDD